jgi:predicted MFS family arabinose efflux permease
MSLNYIGTPIGSAIAGPLIGWSLNASLWAAVAISLVSAVLLFLYVPEHDDVRLHAT